MEDFVWIGPYEQCYVDQNHTMLQRCDTNFPIEPIHLQRCQLEVPSSSYEK
jgi:hypothetical protein